MAGVAALPENLLDMSDVAAARQRFGDLLDSFERPVLPSAVAVQDQSVRTADENEPLLVRTYVPRDASVAAPALLWMHGGGMVMGARGRQQRAAEACSRSATVRHRPC